MRRFMTLVLAAVMLTGCSAKTDSPTPKEVPQIESAIPADMDLTFMSNTVLMSEVTNMLVHPEDYLKEAKSIYPGTVMGKDGMSTELDFEENE